MLLLLQIRDVAIIDCVEVQFGPGLNVITGETGAGKSMLVDALALALGTRASPDLVRAGCEQAEVAAVFDVSAWPTIARRLADAEIPADSELHLRRTLASSASGARSRGYVNGRLVSQSQLAQVSAELVDITSQHEQQSLSDPAAHLSLLDASGDLGALRERMSSAHARLASASAQLDECVRMLRDRTDRLDLLRFQLREISELRADEIDESVVLTERDRLRNASRLREGAARIGQALYDAEHSASELLAAAVTDISELCAIDASLAPLRAELEQAQIQVDEVARQLGRYGREVEEQPDRLAEVEDLHERIQRAKRKYGPTLADVSEHGKRVAETLEHLEAGDARIRTLEEQLESARAEASVIARELSTRRRAAAKKLGVAISKELRTLAMGEAEVVVEISAATQAGAAGVVDGVCIGATGADRVEFMIAPNRGEEPRPLRKIASGGELSRALLAIKRTLVDAGAPCTYVFDEVDAGVGGGTAEVIGRKLASISARNQTLVVTHLAQIAACADRHFVVEKHSVERRTKVLVREVSGEERVAEIARMLGGLRVTDKTRAAARELIAGAARPAHATQGKYPPSGARRPVPAVRRRTDK